MFQNPTMNLLLLGASFPMSPFPFMGTPQTSNMPTAPTAPAKTKPRSRRTPAAASVCREPAGFVWVADSCMSPSTYWVDVTTTGTPLTLDVKVEVTGLRDRDELVSEDVVGGVVSLDVAEDVREDVDVGILVDDEVGGGTVLDVGMLVDEEVGGGDWDVDELVVLSRLAKCCTTAAARAACSR